MRASRFIAQLRKLRLAHVDERLVIASFEEDVGGIEKAGLGHYVEPIAFADRRDGAVNTIVEQPVEFSFGSQRIWLTERQL